MRSRSADRRPMLLRCIAFASVAGLVLVARAQDAPTAAASAPVTAAAPAPDAASAVAARDRARRIEAAVARLRADPDFGAPRKTRELQWKSASPPSPAPSAPAGAFTWMIALARFLDDSSRLLLYGAAIVLAAILAVKLRQFVQLRSWQRLPPEPQAVSHVHDLDVRPQSLPEDIGTAAWQLWQTGRIGDALSLLYRGALSRLIHRDGVPIGTSTTEGECLVLSRDRLAAPRQRYLTRLVRAREAGTYGGQVLSAAIGESLCQGFNAEFDALEPAA